MKLWPYEELNQTEFKEPSWRNELNKLIPKLTLGDLVIDLRLVWAVSFRVDQF